MADSEFPYFEEIKNSYTIFIKEEHVLNLKDKCNSKTELCLVLTVLFHRETSKPFPNILILKACLDYNLIDINKEYREKYNLLTPLSKIILNRYDDDDVEYCNIIELLLKCGADPNITSDGFNSPITISILRNLYKVADLLIEYGGIIDETLTSDEYILKEYPFLPTNLRKDILKFVENHKIVNVKPAKIN
jgi:ankyrin repeat protein